MKTKEEIEAMLSTDTLSWHEALKRIDQLEEACAVAYQISGAAGAPERVLDYFTEVMEGCDSDNPLPVTVEEFDTTDSVENEEIKPNLITELPIYRGISLVGVGEKDYWRLVRAYEEAGYPPYDPNYEEDVGWGAMNIDIEGEFATCQPEGDEVPFKDIEHLL